MLPRTPRFLTRWAITPPVSSAAGSCQIDRAEDRVAANRRHTAGRTRAPHGGGPDSRGCQTRRMDEQRPYGDDLTDLVLNTSPDQFLEALVTVANEGHVSELSITLWVGGQIVSGQLVSAARYLDETALLLEQSAHGHGVEQIVDIYRRLALAAQVVSSDHDEVPVYIHLLDATFGPTRSSVGEPRRHWRGRLSRVDGWILGRFD